MRSCDVIRGLPVLPRFRISPTCQNAVLVSALLHQPIIPVGHHQDVAGGFDMLGELAAFIGTLGQVRWGNMSGIARSQYSRRIDGAVMHVKLHTRRVNITVPEGVRQIRVAPPRWDAGEAQPLRCVIVDASVHNTADGDLTIRVLPGQTIEVHAGTEAKTPPSRSSYAAPKLWPVVRRLLTETRDRLAPAWAALS
jgi:hypothetical protein